MNLRRKVIIFVLILILLSASGCTRQDWQDLIDIAKMWAVEIGVINENGSFNYATAGIYKLFGSTGNREADAVLAAGEVAKNFEETEKLSEEGWRESDIGKVDEAIAKRPGEFRYYNQRGTLLFFSGRQNLAKNDFAAADRMAAKYGKSYQKRNLKSRQAYLDEYYRGIKDLLTEEGEIEYWSLQLSLGHRLFELSDDPSEKQHYQEEVARLQQAYDVLYK